MAESRGRSKRVVKDQLLIAGVILLALVSHRLTLEIVGIGVNRADVVLIMIALVGTHALAVIFSRAS